MKLHGTKIVFVNLPVSPSSSWRTTRVCLH